MFKQRTNSSKSLPTLKYLRTNDEPPNHRFEILAIAHGSAPAVSKTAKNLPVKGGALIKIHEGAQHAKTAPKYRAATTTLAPNRKTWKRIQIPARTGLRIF